MTQITLSHAERQTGLVCSCTIRRLPSELQAKAVMEALRINPANRPPPMNAAPDSVGMSQVDYIAVATNRRWHTKGVKLTVGFLDNPSQDLRTKILSHMNAWSKTANVAFTETATDPQVRIARTPGKGHWSYLGTDILQVAKDQPTMNLDGFTTATQDSEFYRVVRHETGHTLGCPHEHMRADLVARIDVQKAIAFYGATQGWTPEQVRQQVLTPLDPASIIGTTSADAKSIMCYMIPETITVDGKPIPGGTDIDASDYAFMAAIYPKPASAPVAPASAPTASDASEAIKARMAELDALATKTAHDRAVLAEALALLAPTAAAPPTVPTPTAGH